MARTRSALSWIFLRGPAGYHELAESRWHLTWLITVGGMAAVAGIGAGIGALAGLLAGNAVADAAWVGAGIGAAVLVAWLLMSIVVIGVLWVRGISPALAASDHQKPQGRHAGTGTGADGWRRRGDPLVPGTLVAFFVLMTVCFGSLAGQEWHRARGWDEPTAVVDGVVVEIHGPAWYDKGSGDVVVRYAVGGAEYRVETDRDPGDRFFRLNDVLPIEYAVARPSHGRAVWAVEAARSGLGSLAVIVGICAALAIATGIGNLVGRRRVSRR